jgi:hypothetical protein
MLWNYAYCMARQGHDVLFLCCDFNVKHLEVDLLEHRSVLKRVRLHRIKDSSEMYDFLAAFELNRAVPLQDAGEQQQQQQQSESSLFRPSLVIVDDFSQIAQSPREVVSVLGTLLATVRWLSSLK